MKLIYRITLLSLLIVCITTYFTKIDVSSSSRGIIRSESENVTLHTVMAKFNILT